MNQTLTRLCPSCSRPVYIQVNSNRRLKGTTNCEPVLNESYRRTSISRRVVFCTHPIQKLSGERKCYQTMLVGSKQWKKVDL